ncbi:CLUMA_CG016959, isoform A [Clunio marinus]|uniref:CLUMA_CG016959, isoform A n=1 Tax=Clunio marinus TaxID=568069 RepID=A0A1J1IVB3_9DIPT|nr:CLUMA_CG016959, isoform A [Clunio marinus]
MKMIVKSSVLLIVITFVSTVSSTSRKCEPVPGCTENGEFYPIGASVPQNTPCKTCYCSENGLECAEIFCDAPPPGCVAQNNPDQCCPEINCGCEVDGVFYPIYEPIPQEDPCTICVCSEYGLECGHLYYDCPFIPRGCVHRNIPGQCCPEILYCGCKVNGTVYPVESDVPSDDSCFTCSCNSFGQFSCKAKIECSKPQPGCVYQTPPGQCCPEILYCGCMVNGTVYPLESDVPSPCFCYCDFKGTVSCEKECPIKKYGCVYQDSPDQCCPELSYCGCMVNGTLYESAIPSDDCPFCTCFFGEVRCEQEECCMKDDGSVYPYDFDIPNDDPCLSCYCSIGYVQCDTKECSEPPPGCENAQPSPGVCCPDFQALGCETSETSEMTTP